MWGRSRARHRHERIVEGLRTAWPAHRLDCRRRRRLSRRRGRTTTTRRSRPARLSDRLARVALTPARGADLFERTRAHPAREPAADRSVAARARGGFLWIRPEAGAIVYVRYDYPINSTDARDPSARGEERARSSPAIISAWTATCAWASVSGPSITAPVSIGCASAAVDRCDCRRTVAPSRRAPSHVDRRIAMNQPELALVLIGFGNVARRFIRLLDEIADRLDFTWRVVAICDATSRQRRRSAMASTRDARSATVGGVAVARSPRSRAARTQRHRRHPPGHRPARRRSGGRSARRHRDDGARHRSRRAGDVARARRARRPGARRHRQQGPGGVRVSRARSAGRIGRSHLLLRRRGDGRRAGVQPRARNACRRSWSRAFAA